MACDTWLIELVSFPVTVIKCPNTSDLREKGLVTIHSPGVEVQSIMAEKSQWQGWTLRIMVLAQALCHQDVKGSSTYSCCKGWPLPFHDGLQFADHAQLSSKPFSSLISSNLPYNQPSNHEEGSYSLSLHLPRCFDSQSEAIFLLCVFHSHIYN